MVRGGVAIGVAVAAILLPATLAEAHAFLLGTSPAPGAVVVAAPTEVVLRFSEPVTPFGRGVDVYAPSGRQVARPATALGTSMTAVLDLPSMVEPGTYVVDWRVTAQDTHPARGSFAFSIGRAGPPAAPAGLGGAAAVSSLAVALQAASRWAHFAGFAAVFGVLLLGALAGVATTPRLERAVAVGLALLVVAAPLSVAAQALSLGGLDPQTMADVTASPFGRVVALQLGVALLAWAALPLLTRSRRWLRFGVPALAAALALVDGLAAHAGGGAVFWLTWPVSALHVGAMAVWVGGLLALLLLAGEPAASVTAAARRFAAPALGALVVAVVSGAVLAAVHLRVPADLLLAPYGLLLLAKILAVGVTMAAAGLSRRAGKPLRLEAAGMLGILLLASLLGSLPPVR